MKTTLLTIAVLGIAFVLMNLSLLIKSIETFSISIGSEESSGIKVPLKDLISFGLKEVPIEHPIKSN